MFERLIAVAEPLAPATHFNQSESHLANAQRLIDR